jgi:hypothetical protein
MQACCDLNFRRSAVRWADVAAKEHAKAWVENNSCHAWRNGWLMVDGTLIPLYARPAFFGNVFFDRKSNYSLNVQVCSNNLSKGDNRMLTFVDSSFQLLIYGFLISPLGFLAVNMTLQLGRQHECFKNTRPFSKRMNGFGGILHIHYETGVSLPIKSKVFLCCSTCH